MRRERADHSGQTTTLVNEAYIRLVDYKRMRWQNRAHFFAQNQSRRSNLKQSLCSATLLVPVWITRKWMSPGGIPVVGRDRHSAARPVPFSSVRNGCGVAP
jgi:ECF sigma factor